MRKLSALTAESKEIKRKFRSGESFKIFNRTFVSCERGWNFGGKMFFLVTCYLERCKAWASEFELVVVSDSEALPGYRVNIVEEW